ncbi:MAG: DJ-1/PfpI family protein [Candidatus Omnitrophota bacterium]
MDKIFMISLLLPMLIFSFISSANGQSPNGKKILAIIASSNFRDEELLVPKGIFEEEGFKVVVASSSLEASRGMLGAEIKPNILIGDVNVDDYDAVIFVGGSGASEYWDNEIAHKIAKDTLGKKKLLAAICIAPITLANAGVLNNKRATVWFSEANKLAGKGASYTGSVVEVDGDIITANGPTSASEFAEAIVKKLK